MSRNVIDQNLPLARHEFTNHLNHFLVPLIHRGFTSIYEDAKNICEKNNRENETLKYFQIFVKRIPNWNATILDNETKRINQECDFIMKIVTAIFTSYVKILSSVRIKGNNSNIKIKIPMCDVFIHSVYKNSAKVLFYKPWLFKDNVDNLTRKENAEEIDEIIVNAIEETLTSLIPIENILQEYIGNIYDDDNVENEEIESEEEQSEDGQSVYCEEEEEPEGYYEEENEPEEYKEETKVVNFGNSVPNDQNVFEKDNKFIHENDHEEENEPSDIESDYEEENDNKENVHEEYENQKEFNFRNDENERREKLF